jgi:uncharacterized protein YqfA (UPF0365 family)
MSVRRGGGLARRKARPRPKSLDHHQTDTNREVFMLLAQSIMVTLVMLAPVIFCLVASGLLFAYYFPLWLKATTAGARVSLGDMLRMTISGVKPRAVIDALVTAKQGEVRLSSPEVEAAYLKGVNLDKVIQATVRAKQQGLDLSFQELVEEELRTDEEPGLA